MQHQHSPSPVVPAPRSRPWSWSRSLDVEDAPGAGRRRQRLAVLAPGLRGALLAGTVLLVVGQPLRAAVDRPWLDAALDTWLFHVDVGLAGALVALRAALLRGQRLAWSLLAVGIAAWLVGDLWWQAEFEALGSDADSPNVTDLWYLTFYAAAGAALVLLTVQPVGSAHRVVWIDGVVAGLGGAAVAVLGFGQITGRGSPSALAVDLIYPIADLVLLGVAIGVVAAKGWRLSPVWTLLGLGIALLIVADLNYAITMARRSYEQGMPADLGWPVGFALMALAAWLPVARARPPQPGPALLVPTLVMAVSVGMLVAAPDGDLPGLAVVLAAAALLGAALRTALAFRELQSLLESRRLAVTDELTGLGNRRLLTDRLTDLLRRRHPGDVLAVLLLDLDRFKEVNDALGHHVGDDLLRAIGPRLERVLRDQDVLTRLGGDEFALLLGPGSDATHATAVAVRVREALRAPFELDGVQLHLDGSVGIALCPDHALTGPGLLQCADVAMYEAKNSRTGFALYAPERDRHDRTRLQLIAQLHAAIPGGQLVCHYQPQSELATGRIVGAEALVRWEHPERGLLEPEHFLGLAAQVGLMPQLTRQVLAMALRDCAAWRRDGRVLGVSVNVSGHALDDSGLSAEVARLLRVHALPADALVIEVTEDVMLEHKGRASAVVAQLQTLGVRLSIDDYGTGYSSLTRLRTLPVHELKLDRSYIAGLGSDERDAAIVDSTVALAHALGLTVVAEGIETADDWQSLRVMGCDRAQGHLLSRPLPAPRFATWLSERAGAALLGSGR